MDLAQYAQMFVEESKENLQNLNSLLLKLEKDPNEISIIADIFRVAHTLKGMSATMGYNKIANLTHVMEDSLDRIRNSKKAVDLKLVDTMFRCLDALEGYVSSIERQGDEGEVDHGDLIKEFSSVQEVAKNFQSAKVENESDYKEKKNEDVNVIKGENGFDNLTLDTYEIDILNKVFKMETNLWRIDISLDKGCLLKAARAFLFFKMLEEYGEVLKSVPVTNDIEDEKFDFDISVIIASMSDEDSLKKGLEGLSEIEKFNIRAILESELVSSWRGIEGVEQGEVAGENEVEAINPSPRKKATKHGKTVRVDIERLDVLMNLVSELIITKTRLEGAKGTDKSKDKDYEESLEYLQRTTTSLHDAVMKVRMVPVESVFNRFPRMIRDVSKELDKKIKLELSGEDTELDRTIIDEIGEPLIHLLRNSADHGIEDLEKRRDAGKEDEGHISLRAYQAGNDVIIEVEDDGGGIDVEKVKKKAVESGLVEKDELKKITEKEAIDFLFNSGFSTADKVSDLSGRGVGLDAVKGKITELGGKIEVDNKVGIGTKFTIKLPMTLAIMQALMVVVGDERYAIALNGISEIINVKRQDISVAHGKSTFILRDDIVGLSWLRDILDVPDVNENPDVLTVVVAKKGERSIGIVVDELIGQREIVIKSLGRLFTDVKAIAGATILGDGGVVLIVDTNSL